MGENRGTRKESRGKGSQMKESSPFVPFPKKKLVKMGKQSSRAQIISNSRISKIELGIK